MPTLKETRESEQKITGHCAKTEDSGPNKINELTEEKQ
jgi:hypothetical protein